MNFTFKLKNISALALVAVAVFNLSSCKSDDNDVTSTVVTGKEPVFFDLIKNQAAETIEASTINFSGISSATVKPSTTAYKFGYFDLKGKTVEDIKVADLKGLDFKEATSLGLDATSMHVPLTGPTWMIYAGAPTHAVYPTADRFVLLYKGASLSENADDVIIFKAEELITVGRDITFKLKVKQFTK
jgi:hypothetical protein